MPDAEVMLWLYPVVAGHPSRLIVEAAGVKVPLLLMLPYTLIVGLPDMFNVPDDPMVI